MEGICIAIGMLGAGVGTYSILTPAKAVASSQEGLPARADVALSGFAAWPPVRAAAALPSVSAVSQEVRRRLAEMDVHASPDACDAAVVLSVPASFAVGALLSGSAVGGGVLALLMAGSLPALAQTARRRAREAVVQEMPQVLRSLASALGSGKTLAQAISFVGTHATGRAAAEFSRASLELKCGMSASDALEGLAGRLDAPGARLLVGALVISQRTGSPLESLLARTAQLVERQEELERTLRVKTAQARLSVRVVCTMPLVMVGILSLGSPEFRQGLATPIGLACVLVALVMDGVALLVVRRLMKGVL